MCGIAGMLDASPAFDPGRALEAGHRMAAVIRHRGPDGGGVFVDPASRAMLAHRRLAVVDLTRDGAQPMVSRSGRTVVAFNGEIYNFRELRARWLPRIGLAGWRSQSDTEFLVEAIEAAGLAATLAEVAGMFAFAVLDRMTGRVTLVRDRFGEKPLYFQATAARLLFASDADPIVAVAGRPATDPQALDDLLRYGAIQQPRSIHEGIEQVPPGAAITFTVRDGIVAREAPAQYWRLEDEARDAVAGRARQAPGDARAAVENALNSAIGEQMLADVPVGAFLSGGIDSSLVTAMMQARSTKKVRTFTIGFQDRDYDESADAEVVARHLGTDHTTFMLTEAEVLGMIGEVVQAYAEPFADSSQIPTFCVARLARAEVTTVLTGDAGDEMFGGYNRHVFAATLWPRLSRLPLPARQLAARAIRAADRPLLASAFDRLGRRLPGMARSRRTAEKLRKAGSAISAGSVTEYHESLMRLSADAGCFLRRDGRQSSVALGGLPDPPGFTAAETLMLLDTARYLPNDILVKVDRATMAVALESRAPFLDHRVFAAAWRLAPTELISHGKGKRILRQLLARHLPPELFERPKSGFSLPLGRWLRTGLADFAGHHLDPQRLLQSGLFDEAAIGSVWARHRSGDVEAAAELWPVLMFQAWLDRRPASSEPAPVLARSPIEAVHAGAPPAILELTR